MTQIEDILTGTNAAYVAQMYARYLAAPTKVDESWRAVFDALPTTQAALLRDMAGASWTPPARRVTPQSFDRLGAGAGMAGETSRALEASAAPRAGPITQEARATALDSVRALMLIRAYRARGHLLADLDPLGLKDPGYHPELDPAHYGFTGADYTRPIFLDGVLGMEHGTLTEILDVVRQTYCGKIGVEFLHLYDPAEKSWIQRRIEEPRNKTDFTHTGKQAILKRLTEAELFESFLHKKYPGTKRFGLDGGEVLIPAIEQIMKRGGQLGLKEVVIGMSHRGRLNVLAHVLNKPMTAIFSEFRGGPRAGEDILGSGDVKYHLGASGCRTFDENLVCLSLVPNPSHLEAVNPVVEGSVRAKQVRALDRGGKGVMPLLLHGDAAFAGQGIIAETLMISELPGYRVGGTIHIVVNNQIGFTTMPQYTRSGPYPTDVAKMLGAPIFHVNGDDPEAVVHVARIATEFRQTFGRDVVVDIVCYRRFGHNEGDEPMFTQPRMYTKIAASETSRALYARHLVAEGVLDQARAEAMESEAVAALEAAFADTEHYAPESPDMFGGAWKGLTRPGAGPRRGTTAVAPEVLESVGRALTTVPEGFRANRKLLRLLKAKENMLSGDAPLDWATAEALAMGSLVTEEHIVRLSGQDVGRGTFSQRHAIWYDQETEAKHIPLAHIGLIPSGRKPERRGNGLFHIHDSPLSEAAVAGFEYGYTLADPHALVLWEAQFGDFANGAQVHIDQFLAAGESKWGQMSGLVLLLPHGYEGQGPEHSSARVERFLQLSAEDNWQVCNCTTPANYFHALRRQMHRDFRKPLILFTPKSLLRHKLATSPLADLTGDSAFHRFLWDDDNGTLHKVRRVVLCSGKVYYDLLETRRARGTRDVALIRVEQLYPFPADALAKEIGRHARAEVVWCQEEPQNQGAWTFVAPLIEGLDGRRPRYIGRPAAAAPATGLMARHMAEQKAIVDAALG
ncbi:MAG TPA: 2-oxoglutarate dehydrogenase E1 component [Rhodospirillaceae bacterium]|nr:2-oxoglutarate dehydrogenase E1 component [Alphaproteobacteria bacterium]HBH26250.1 2-oxoglutarate dehydrogenase E1 component [Rhodospirillaceae bacterium]